MIPKFGNPDKIYNISFFLPYSSRKAENTLKKWFWQQPGGSAKSLKSRFSDIHIEKK